MLQFQNTLQPNDDSLTPQKNNNKIKNSYIACFQPPDSSILSKILLKIIEQFRSDENSQILSTQT